MTYVLQMVVQFFACTHEQIFLKTKKNDWLKNSFKYKRSLTPLRDIRWHDFFIIREVEMYYVRFGKG